MAAFREPLDAALRPLAARGPGRVALHHLHECYDDRARPAQLVAAYYADVFPVRAPLCLVCAAAG